MTRPEEFREQRYEGAASYFGQWALPAYQTALDDLLPALHTCRPACSTNLGAEPQRFSSDDLDPRRFRA